MKCPKCKKEGMKYLNRERVGFPKGENTKFIAIAKDKTAKCFKCGFEGEVM